MSHSAFYSRIVSVLLAGTLLFVAGCDSTGSGADDDGAGRPDGAVLIAERFNTPDGRVSYMGAFSGLPNEPVDVSELTELGPSGKAFACG